LIFKPSPLKSRRQSVMLFLLSPAHDQLDRIGADDSTSRFIFQRAFAFTGEAVELRLPAGIGSFPLGLKQLPFF
jgi:hypothetical protein